jgi:hypothetical protein
MDEDYIVAALGAQPDAPAALNREKFGMAAVSSVLRAVDI